MVRSEKRGAFSSLGLAGARRMTASCIKTLVRFIWLNQLVTKKHFVSCVMATDRLLQPLSTDIFSQWALFLILRNRAVAAEQLLCNNLPLRCLCVSSWNWCLNSFLFVRLHWFCSSPESWLRRSWLQLSRRIPCWSGVSSPACSFIFMILYQFQAALRTSWNRTSVLKLCPDTYSLLLQTLSLLWDVCDASPSFPVSTNHCL